MSINRYHSTRLLCLVMAAFGTAVALAQAVGEPPGFLEVEQIVCYEVKLRTKPEREAYAVRGFNQGRPYAISINEHLPGARDARARMARDLFERKQSDKVVSEWFGTEPPERLTIMIGREVPVEIAQAVISAYAVGAKLPASIVVMERDAGFQDTRRVYIGSPLDLSEKPTRPEIVRGLLRPGLTREEFAKHLPPWTRP